MAPEPDPPPRTRRAFLYGLLVGGAAAGLGALALRGAGGAPEPAAEPAEGDERLRWALELQQRELGALVADHETFLWIAQTSGDPRLEAGLERLAIAVLEDAPETQGVRRTLATSLAMIVDGLGEQHPMSRFVPALRAASRR